MTGDFQAFFKLVKEAARQHGIKAHLVCGVTQDGTGGQVHVSSNGACTFMEKDPQFLERCYDTMEESLDVALAQLAGIRDDPTQLMN